MLTYFIRNLFILLISIYTFYKLHNISSTYKNNEKLLIIISPLISIIAAKLFINNQIINWLFIIFVFFLMMKLFNTYSLSITYLSVLISFAFSFITYCLATIIASLLLFPFFSWEYNLPLPLICTLIHCIQFGWVYLCFHIPRLQKGMKFIHNLSTNNIVATISLFSLMILIMFYQSQAYKYANINTYILTFSFVMFTSFIIFLCWWNYHITQTYRKFLRKNELDSLNLLLEKKNQEIAYLKSENDKLSGIIHKDNKIIPALNMAIINSYENKTSLDLSALKTDSSLHMKLKQLYDERMETLANYQQEIMHLPQTAFDSVNAILSYMQTESLNANIPFQVMLFDNLDSTIPNEIAEDDFTHMLSDLLANAIYACKDISSPSIQLYLGKMDGISTIKILNTGNAFDIETLKTLGLARHTTHADTGGSGIGLMDIWKIKERYGATLLIDEAVNDSVIYTCINILFNHKKHYIIQSDRQKKLSAQINRPDLMIISKERVYPKS